MMRTRLLGRVLLACLPLLAACGDENALARNDSYTGLWRSDGLAGTTLLFEIEQRGDLLDGSLYSETATGERGEPSPLRFGRASGEGVFFSAAFEGSEYEGDPIDTLSFSGTRRSADVIDMRFYFCAGDTCYRFPFLALREPSGF